MISSISIMILGLITISIIVLSITACKPSTNVNKTYTIEFLDCENNVTHTIVTTKVENKDFSPVIVYYDPQTQKHIRYHGHYRIIDLDDWIRMSN